MSEIPFPLGRNIEFDEKSKNYPVRALFGAAKKPRGYTWRCETFLDQGVTSSCVGNAWMAELAARPSVYKGVNFRQAWKIYQRAQQLDQWPGEEPAYLGTSVLAGAKAIQEMGAISEYRWAFNLNDLILAVGYQGPAVIGTLWTMDMFTPDAKGFIHPTGTPVGGHAYLVNGVSVKGEYFKIHNSWGQEWGVNGTAKISFGDMEILLDQEGEACIPVKRNKQVII